MNSNRIFERAEQYFQHDMIQSYTDLPAYPHTRAHLLYTFLQKASDVVPTRLKELFPLVTTLMQVALDTHDMVDTNSRPNAYGLVDRTTQLRVLAGDYFSSRFYQLLAQAGQIEWVKHLSRSICDVNHMKMNFYLTMKQLKMTAEEHLRQTVEIKTRLFKTFTDVFEGRYRVIWPDILDAFTRIEILTEELDRFHSLRHFKDSWIYWCLMDHVSAEERKSLSEGQIALANIRQLLKNHGIKSKLQAMVDQQFKQLLDKINKLQSDYLVHELHQMAMPMLPHQKV